MRVSRFVLLSAALLLPSAAPRLSAQSIAGLVLDEASRLPAPRLAVQILGDSDRVVLELKTDTAGVFHAMLPANGVFRVRFVLDDQSGFVSDSISVHDDAFVQRQFVLRLPRTFFEFEVEKQVHPRPNLGRPVYPPDLRERSVEGHVLAQFVVDTTGMPIFETFRVLRSTDPAFAQAVRVWLLTARYYPAERGGRLVRQMVQQPFDFKLSGVAIPRYDAAPLFPAREPMPPQRPRP
jgi:Gram-negative bacterial TonB protein C-terminal